MVEKCLKSASLRIQSAHNVCVCGCGCVSFFGLLPNALVGRSHDLSCYWVSLAIRHLSAGAVSIDNSGVLNGDPQNR